MLWCSGVHFYYFKGFYDEKSKHRIDVQGEEWVGPKQFNAGSIIDQVIEKKLACNFIVM